MPSTSNRSTTGEILIKYFGLKLIVAGLIGFGYRAYEFPEKHVVWGSFTAIFTLLGIGVIILACSLKKYRLDKGTTFNRWERFLDRAGAMAFFLSLAAQVPISLNVRPDIAPSLSLICFIGGPVACTFTVLWATLTNVKRHRKRILVEAMLSTATADPKRKPA